MVLPKLHRHGCRICYTAYEDACNDTSDNRECRRCRTGQPGLYDQLGTFTARACCYENCRPLRKNKLKSLDEAALYRLSPSCPWMICSICATTFPYRKPRKDEP